MVAFYLLAGINHFWHPAFYLTIMPAWLPAHNLLVALSGLFEILFALLLIFSRTRVVGAWGMILLLVAVFPANIQMMINFQNESTLKFGLAIARLPIQIALIVWAYGFTKIRPANY